MQLKSNFFYELIIHIEIHQRKESAIPERKSAQSYAKKTYAPEYEIRKSPNSHSKRRRKKTIFRELMMASNGKFSSESHKHNHIVSIT